MTRDQLPPQRPTGARRPGGRSARVRRSVVDAASAELADHGPTGFSIARVAERSGVHQTSIYRRWGTRENLMVEAMLEVSEQALPIPDTGSLSDDLAALAGAVATFLTSPLGTALAQVAALEVDDAALVEARRRFWSTRAGRAAVVLERAIERGEASPDTDPRLVLETLIAPLYMRLLVTGAPLEPDLPRRLSDLLSRSLSPGGSPGSSETDDHGRRP